MQIYIYIYIYIYLCPYSYIDLSTYNRKPSHGSPKDRRRGAVLTKRSRAPHRRHTPDLQGAIPVGEKLNRHMCIHIFISIWNAARQTCRVQD